MKKLLIACPLLFAFIVKGQDAKEFQQLFGKSLQQQNKPLAFPKQTFLSIPSFGEPEVKANTNQKTIFKVLSQDYMICIVPDLSEYRMSNTATSEFHMPKGPGTIPNPGADLKVFR